MYIEVMREMQIKKQANKQTNKHKLLIGNVLIEKGISALTNYNAIDNWINFVIFFLLLLFLY